MFIPCHFWNPKSPVFMTKDDIAKLDVAEEKENN